MRLLRDQSHYIFAYTSKGTTHELATLLRIYYKPDTILDVWGVGGEGWAKSSLREKQMVKRSLHSIVGKPYDRGLPR